MNLMSKIKSFFQTDFLDFFVQKYRNIPTLYKSTFWTVFIVLNIVFAFHTISFFWSNHEWPFLKGDISPRRFWYEARFTQTIPYILFGSKMLPVMMNIFGFCGLSLSAVALAIYWKIPQKKYAYICFSLMVVLMPYNLIWLYHTAQTSYFWAGLIIVGALMLFEKKYKSRYFIWWSILVSMMLFWVMAMNVSFLMVIFICCIGRFFIHFIEGEKISLLFKKTTLLFLNIVVSVIILKLCIIVATHYHIMTGEFYNTQHMALGDIFSKFIKIIPFMFKQFTLTYPFFDRFYLSFLLFLSGISLLMTLWYCIKKRGFVLGFLGIVVMVIGLLIASQLTTLLAKQTGIEFWFRINGYFGLYYIFSLMIALLYYFSKNNYQKNILFIMAVSLITFNVQRDMYAMRVWYQGREAENKLMDRVMGRIEMTDGFRYDKKYGMVLLGDWSLRSRYYKEHFNHNDSSILSWSFRAPWETHTYFNFYAPTDFINNNYKSFWGLEFTKKLFPRISQDTFDFILKKSEVWPDKNSVFIKNNIIFVMLDKKLLKELKKQIKNYLKDGYYGSSSKGIKLYHPNWPGGAEKIEFLPNKRVFHSSLGIFATIVSQTSDKIILNWDCCGKEEFIKNNENIYEFRPK